VSCEPATPTHQATIAVERFARTRVKRPWFRRPVRSLTLASPNAGLGRGIGVSPPHRQKRDGVRRCAGVTGKPAAATAAAPSPGHFAASEARSSV
jgi:septal ring-binding cell division protein DamX